MHEETAVVVGVGPGLGTALVQRFVDAGMRVVAVARHVTELDALADHRQAGRIEACDCDATEPEQVRDLFQRIRSEEAPLQLCVFNAGAFEPAEVVDIEPAEFERCWRIGCLGGFVVGQAAAREMQQTGGGTLIFTGATASLRGAAGFANLAVPKFGLRALAQSMARELGAGGIHVAHAIIDGQILSARYEHLLQQRGADALLDPSAIAEQYLMLHRQPRSAWTHELDLRPWTESF